MTKLYSSSEARKRLGNISTSTFKNLVDTGKIRKITPPGKKQGSYLSEDVDKWAKELAYFKETYSIVTGETDQKKSGGTVFMIASIEDMEAEYELSQRAIGKNTMNAEVRRAWIAKNPESDYIVKHDNKLVAFFHLLPVKEKRLQEFMEGKIRGWDITGEDIEVFEPGKPINCLAIIASEPEVDETTRTGYVVTLVRSTMREMEKLGRRGIVIEKIYATSETPTGIAMAIRAGMKETGTPIGKRLAFVMDMETSQSRIAKSYKRGLEEWKRNNNGQRKERHL